MTRRVFGIRRVTADLASGTPRHRAKHQGPKTHLATEEPRPPTRKDSQLSRARPRRTSSCPAAEEAAELIGLAKEQGLSLTGPDGLLKQLTAGLGKRPEDVDVEAFVSDLLLNDST
jgi:hypothetical protein